MSSRSWAGLCLCGITVAVLLVLSGCTVPARAKAPQATPTTARAAVVARATPTIAINPASGGAGTLVSVSGVGFPANTEVVILGRVQASGVAPQLYARVQVEADGRLSSRFLLPAPLPRSAAAVNQTLTLVAAAEGTTVRATADFEFLAQPSPTPAPQPAATATGTPPATATVLPTPAPINTGTVVIADLNMRAGPASTYGIEAVLPAGTNFIALGQDASSAWLYVVLESGQPGWLSRSSTDFTGVMPLIAAPPPAESGPPPTPQAGAGSLPSVQITSPAPNTVFVSGQQVTVQSVATDLEGVAQIQLLADNAPVQTTTGGATQQTLQASQQWRATTPGAHVLTVIATDVLGNANQPVSVTVEVAADGGPQIQLLQPTQSIVVEAGQQVVIASVANDPAGVTRIELWSDGAIYATVSSANASGESPFYTSQQWSSNTVGMHTLFLRAYDAAGLHADSSMVTIGATDTNPPQVSLNLSASTVNLGQQVTLYTNATDSKGVTAIELWADGVQVAVTNSSSPVGQFSMQARQVWQANQVGQHTLYVVVRDSVGKSTQSENVTVNVLSASASTPTGTPPATLPATSTRTPAPTETPLPTRTRTPLPTPGVQSTPTRTPTASPGPTLPAPPTHTPTPTPTNTPALRAALYSETGLAD